MPLDADFHAMLETTFSLERYTGQDTFGNNTYGSSEDIQGIQQSSNEVFAPGPVEGRAIGQPYTEVELLTDFYGIKVRDKITPPDLGIPVYVTKVTTHQDETGEDLYQELTASTTERA